MSMSYGTAHAAEALAILGPAVVATATHSLTSGDVLQTPSAVRHRLFEDSSLRYTCETLPHVIV